MSARREMEIQVHLAAGNEDLPALTALLEEHHLPTWTLNCRPERSGLTALLTSSCPNDIIKLLRSAGYECEASPVVIVGPAPYQPIAAAQLWMDLRKGGVQVLYSYLSTNTSNRCFLVFRTSDDERALELIHDDEPTTVAA